MVSKPNITRRLFRSARPAPTGWNLIKTLLQTVVFWGGFLYVLPSIIIRLETCWGIPAFAFSGQAPVAIVLFILASIGGLSTGFSMAVQGEGTPLPLDCPRHLVVHGLYRHIRNPMAVTGLTQGFAVGLGLGSWGVLLYVLAGGLVWNLWVRPIEEADLRERFDDAYVAYCAQVRCWIPRLRPYGASGDISDSV